MLLGCGLGEVSRDLPVPGRDLRRRALRDGVPAAAEPPRQRTSDKLSKDARRWPPARNVDRDRRRRHWQRLRRHLATAMARSRVTQFEMMPMPPEQGKQAARRGRTGRLKLRTSSSHDEGLLAASSPSLTKEVPAARRKATLTGAELTVQIEFKDGKLTEVAGSEKSACRAQGRAGSAGDGLHHRRCPQGLLHVVRRRRSTQRGNAKAGVDEKAGYKTSRRQGVGLPATCAAAKVAGGVGDPRRPPGRACRRQGADGRDRAAAVARRRRPRCVSSIAPPCAPSWPRRRRRVPCLG